MFMASQIVTMSHGNASSGGSYGYVYRVASKVFGSSSDDILTSTVSRKVPGRKADRVLILLTDTATSVDPPTNGELIGTSQIARHVCQERAGLPPEAGVSRSASLRLKEVSAAAELIFDLFFDGNDVAGQ